MSKGKHLLDNYVTLDNFLTPIIEKFSFKPDEDFARYVFGIFNEQRIYYHAINGEMCFTLKEFAKYLEKPYNTVLQAFKRKDLTLYKHYLEVKRFLIFQSDKLSLSKRGAKGGKPLILLTFLGVWELLPAFRGDIPLALYRWFGEKLYDLIKRNKLEKGEMLLTDSSNKIVSQVLGDKDRCFVDEKGFKYASKGEMLIAGTLRELGCKFQYNAPIYLTKALIKKLHTDKSLLDVLVKANWYDIPPYITADFLLRTEPRTVIEYWGLEGNSKYDAKKKIKSFIYRELDIRLIDITAHEDQHVPNLKKKLTRELKIK